MITTIDSTLKTLLSRACEISPNYNYKDTIVKYDEGFAQLCRDYLARLIEFDQIKPFPRSSIPAEHVLYGMSFPADGGKTGYAAYVYTLSEYSSTETTIHHDWRVIQDPFGEISVQDSEIETLDAPAGVNFFSDRKPEVTSILLGNL